MKNKLICLILQYFLTSNVFAQGVVIDGVGVLTEKATNPGALGRTLIGV